MGLTQCKECGGDISRKAVSCPKCGAVLKKKTGCLGWIGIGLAILVMLNVIGAVIGALMREGSSTNGIRSQSASSGQTVASNTEAIRKEGETVNVGYTSYAVWRSWWSSQLSDNQFLNEPPNAMYLFVELTVRNNDKKERIVPPLKLLDEKGAEYQASSRGFMLEGAIGLLESLNPSVSTQGYVVFDVPKDRSYKLVLDGGFWSSENAYVKLDPK